MPTNLTLAAVNTSPSMTLGAAGDPQTWYMVLGLGQSLMSGSKGQNAVSTVQNYANRTFGSGPKSGKPGNTAGATNTSPGTTTSKLLVEDNLDFGDGTGRGETILSGLTDQVLARALAAGDIAEAEEFVIFASVASHGGYSIDQLNEGTAWIAVAYDHINEFVARANEAGATPRVLATLWMQGESDTGMAQAEYETKLLAYKRHIEGYAQNATGQAEGIPMFTYQTPSGSNPALAQLALVQAYPAEFKLATPIYHILPSADGTHLTQYGYRWTGELFGRAVYEWAFGAGTNAILPVACTVNGAEVRVVFGGGFTSPLTLDTSTLPNTTDYGFQVRDDGVAATISSVAIEGSDTVLITLAAPPAGAVTVRYAKDYLGTGTNWDNEKTGNLRDSNVQATPINGASKPLYRVAPHFEVAAQDVTPVPTGVFVWLGGKRTPTAIPVP